MAEGVHCVGCGAAYFETIEQGLAGHGRTDEEVDAVIAKLNAAIPRESGDENIVITENAARKAKELVEKRGKNEALRIDVSPCGCAGNDYHFSFELEQNDHEYEFEV